MMFSSAEAAGVGGGFGSTPCAKLPRRAQNSPIARTSTHLIYAANLRHPPCNSMSLQKPVHFLGQFRADPRSGCDLFGARFAQPVYRSESPQQEILSVLTHARTIVENALADSLLHQQLVICVSETVGFVAYPLEQPQRT